MKCALFNSEQPSRKIPSHSRDMPDTGERRSITRLANAKEAETVHESKDLASKTKQRAEKAALQNRFRGQRNAPPNTEAKPVHLAGPVPAPVETEDDSE